MAATVLINHNEKPSSLIKKISNTFYFPLLCFQLLCVVFIASAQLLLSMVGWSLKMLRAAVEVLGASSFYQHCMGTEQAEHDAGWGPKSTLKMDISPLASSRDYTPSAGTLIIIFPLLWEQFHPYLFSFNCLDTIFWSDQSKADLKIYVFHSKHDVNCWQALSSFVLPKTSACSGPFQNMRSTMFPNCCVLVPVHMKDNTRLKYPTGNEGTSVCLRAVLATSRVIRKYLLTSPYLHQLNKQK